MAKTGRAVAKLVEKDKRRAMKARLGGQSALITRTRSSYHDKVLALETHKHLIHGFTHGRLVNAGGINLGCRVTDLSKDGSKRGVTFRGDGLPDDSLGETKAPKSNAERAKEDKRPRLATEWREGFKPQRYVTKWQRARGL